MTPKEKANRLYLLYITQIGFFDSTELYRIEIAKRLATMAVDEVLTIVHTVKQEQYWEQVKNEINKL